MANTQPSVTGLLEAALYVEEVARAMDFYQDLFGFEPELRNEFIGVLRVPGAGGTRALILFPRSIAQSPSAVPPTAIDGPLPTHGGSGRMHVAFSIQPDQLEPWKNRLTDRGIKIEGITRWKRGGTSLYFRDPDEHAVELVTPGIWSFY
jgi:catechol 2,3-dioxygenase-like lactoylglutathione lyase family enzyme